MLPRDAIEIFDRMRLTVSSNFCEVTLSIASITASFSTPAKICNERSTAARQGLSRRARKMLSLAIVPEIIDLEILQQFHHVFHYIADARRRSILREIQLPIQ
ncbi:hypothetical protein PMAYCL1PPCAC_20451, partial [Pristionchus mayeri]